MLEFETTNGYKVQISDEDFDMMLCYTWHYIKREIICNTRSRKNQKLHLMIASKMGLGGPTIDHKDRNIFNNQRSNLREATYSQQNQNKEMTRNNTTGYKGISYCRKNHKYKVYIKKQYLGLFKNAEDAAKIYDKAAKEMFGDFAVLNFPEE